ncbi:MAG: hypothetical protein P8I93_04290 [Crocinitomicaceae bacterium]|nr:hypothetical protein [Crocinitomicaceae bacterium]
MRKIIYTFFVSVFLLGLFSCTEKAYITENPKNSISIYKLINKDGDKIFVKDSSSSDVKLLDTNLIIIGSGVYKKGEYNRTIQLFIDKKPFTGSAYQNDEDGKKRRLHFYKNGYLNGYCQKVIDEGGKMMFKESIFFEYFENGYFKAATNSSFGALDKNKNRVGKWCFSSNLAKDDSIKEKSYLVTKIENDIQFNRMYDYSEKETGHFKKFLEKHSWIDTNYTKSYDESKFIRKKDEGYTLKNILLLLFIYVGGFILILCLIIFGAIYLIKKKRKKIRNRKI